MKSYIRETNGGKFDNFMDYTVNIVSSYLSRNKVAADEVVGIIHNIYDAVLCMDSRTLPANKGGLIPAVPIEKSVYSDYIICLEDGKKLKMLKKHLRTAYNMSPEEYKTKWGLAHNYPMVAPEYAIRRSRLARDIGLGRGKFK